MTRRSAYLAILLCCGALAAGPETHNLLTPAEQAAGWELLFDGRTMNGWEDPRVKNPPGDAWSIEDGCLKATPHPRITEDLFSREKFRDFELLFDWRLARGSNTGVKYRIQDRIFLAAAPVHPFEALVNFSLAHRPPRRASGQEYVIGFEYQLIDQQRYAGALHGEVQYTGALYDMVAPLREAAKPVGEFNHSRLVVRGSHVEHWLNGVKVVDAGLDSKAVAESCAKRWGAGTPAYELLVKQPRRECPISLQNHGDAAWFRNIKIRRLP
ncbi:MAG TPA: DUF1080 domain-containing protein [Bryobacteraceae bacterium]|nr:DUF1080 domain-containing protein [Bryobacteraceae bacterium]